MAKLARIGLFETFWLPTLYTTSMFVGVIFGSKLKHPWQCLTYFLPAFGAPLQSVYCVSFSYYQVPQFVEQCRRGSRGGPRGPCPPPSPQNSAPPNSQARIQGGQEGLAPPPGGQEGLAPPLTKSWIRLCNVIQSSIFISVPFLEKPSQTLNTITLCNSEYTNNGRVL